MMDDADILHPERVVDIGGRQITVAEITFRQSLDIGPEIAAIVIGLDGIVGDGSDLSGLLEALYQQPGTLVTMLEMTTGVPAEWIEGLAASDGDEMVMAFWGVNAAFFAGRLLVRRKMAEVARGLETST